MAVTTINGYKVDLDAMKSSTCGMIGTATKDGKTYFCKKFNNPVQPARNGAMSERTIQRNQKLFDDFKQSKMRLNAKLRDISGEGGNIVIPQDQVIYDNHWFEFSEYVEGAISDSDYTSTISRLSENERLLLLKIATGALMTLHQHKIVHADLKLTNIMLVRNSAGHYVSKIIDLDGAFFEDDVPTESVTGTPDYYSPEQAVYCDVEDPEDRMPLRYLLTTKSDIFTMGLIFHEYLAGSKPEPDALAPALQRIVDAGKFVYPWQVLLTPNPDGTRNQLKISSRITNKVYIALISDMLNTEASLRPTASDILRRLNNNELPIQDETWPEDAITINMPEAAKKVLGLRKREIKRKDKPVIRCYEIIESDGRRYTKSAAELVTMGIASPAEVVEDPWPEDHMSWDTDKLQTMFVCARRGSTPGIYQMIDRSGNSRTVTASQLRMLRFAIPEGAAPSPTGRTPAPGSRKPKGSIFGSSAALPPTVPVPAAESGKLWDEDAAAYRIDAAAAASKGMTFVGRIEMSGIKGYQFSDTNGTLRFMNRQTCLLMRFLVPKA